jgi:hypothetical protein
MKDANFKRTLLLLAMLVYLSFTSIHSRAAYPGWTNDVDQIPDGDSIRHAAAGVGGSLYFISPEPNGSVVRRWPPLPGQIAPEQICGISGGGVHAIYNGYLYISSVTEAWNDETGEVDPHGIVKINLATHIISDAVSVTPTPPSDMIWDHNGTLYIACDSWTAGSPIDHYEGDLFKKWTGSSWATVGGGLHVNNVGYSKALRLGTDGTNIYVGGAFLGAKNGGTVVNSTNIIRWNVDTGLWTAMDGYGLSEWPTGIAVSGTNVLVSGSFSGGVRRYSNVDGSSLSIGTADSDGKDVAALNGEFYLAGNFSHIGGNAIEGIAKWNGASWSTLGSGLNSGGQGRELWADGNSIFLFGVFNAAGGLSTPYGKARWQVTSDADAALRFTSGSLTNSSTVNLTLAGIPTEICNVERLDFSTDTWVSQGTVTLNNSGTGSFTSSTTNGLGYFRARSIDGVSLSTNAFGSIIGAVPSGYWMVGTPFSGMSVSNMFPSPLGGTSVFYQTNGSLTSISWDDLSNVWSPSDRGLSAGEGVVVYTAAGGTNTIPYQAYGLFSENSFSRILPTGYSIITSPLFHKYSGGSATQIDEFNSTRLGGYSLVPVNSTANPKARASRNKAGVANQYIDYTLTTGSQWQTNSVNTTVPILIGEGVWLENRFGSSQTWSVSTPIW